MPVSGMLAVMSRTSLMAVGAVAFIVLVVAVAVLLRSQRGKEAPPFDPTFAWGEPHGDFAPLPVPDQAPAPLEPAPPLALELPAIDSPAPVPSYLLQCPACQSQFKAQGIKPIVTNCPACGKKGYLR